MYCSCSAWTVLIIIAVCPCCGFYCEFFVDVDIFDYFFNFAAGQNICSPICSGLYIIHHLVVFDKKTWKILSSAVCLPGLSDFAWCLEIRGWEEDMEGSWIFGSDRGHPAYNQRLFRCRQEALHLDTGHILCCSNKPLLSIPPPAEHKPHKDCCCTFWGQLLYDL